MYLCSTSLGLRAQLTNVSLCGILLITQTDHTNGMHSFTLPPDIVKHLFHHTSPLCAVCPHSCFLHATAAASTTWSIPSPRDSVQFAPCRAVWQQCEAQLAELGNGSEACLRLQQVHALTQLEEQHGPYDAVVVAAGAAAATLPEVGQFPFCCCTAACCMAYNQVAQCSSNASPCLTCLRRLPGSCPRPLITFGPLKAQREECLMQPSMQGVFECAVNQAVSLVTRNRRLHACMQFTLGKLEAVWLVQWYASQDTRGMDTSVTTSERSPQTGMRCM